MFQVIERYIAREVLQAIFGVLIVLLLIFVSNRLVRYLGDVASGELPSEILLTLLSLQAIKFFILLLPPSMYFAVLLVLGRLYRDSEMSAMHACGIGPGRIYKGLLLVALPITLLSGWVSFIVVPKIAEVEYKITDNAKQAVEITGVTAGVFKRSGSGEKIFYVENMTDDKQLSKNVFIYAKIKQRTVVFSAKTARVRVFQNEGNRSGSRFLVLENGFRYDGQPGQADYRMTQFDTHAIKLESKLKTDTNKRRDWVPIEKLWQSVEERTKEIRKQEAKEQAKTKLSPAQIALQWRRDQAELQWRIAIPLSGLLLVLLAVPIGRVTPRQGQYGKLAIAIPLYIVYFLLLTSTKAKIAKGSISPELGMWWIHVLVVILTISLLAKQMGFSWIKKRFLGLK